MAYCDRCMRYFAHDRALEQHKEDSNNHWDCDDCDLDFESYDLRRQHYIQSRNHHYCKECDRLFNSEEGRRQHMDAKHWYCETHDRTFRSEEGLHSHYRQSSDHHFCHIHCTDCNRTFQNESNLRHHLNSKLHRPNTIRCPGRGCKRSFVSPSALTLHFESGSCASRMTREQLNKLVVRADKNNYITNPARLLGGPPGEYEPPLTSTTWATERSWNGEAYECFLCNSTFKTLERLNQHLQSPRHEDKIYRCPKQDCRTEFVTLSGLCQHVEGGSCGVRMFKQVQNVMESLTRGFNAITI
ncbi:hypothetical protein B0F90DRAFT_1811632 [Multifurca ochricompacta]|uniref:C2H2-type domain-containing protein n=1 Tax=Multifurca ochricompacta TaxID=376703 RepID=A0AAD4LYG8_9AGAM|nr:hypothetical protein B0F90DRAFT_1811632 [Multifurca ochricompacta]